MFDGLKNHIAGLLNPTTLAIGGFTALTGVVASSFDEFQKYAGSVRDLSLITGTGAEATSRFLQVIDDYQLTAEDATMATKALKEKGLVPTIDTLAMLAEKYQAIQDPAEKMAFIQDNLGKGGARWVNVLNQQGDALRKAAGEVDNNLVLTEEQIKQSEQARLAIDAMSDAWQGFKVSIGSAVGAQIVEIDNHQKAIALLKERGIAVGRGVENTDAYKQALRDLENAELGAARAAELHGSKLDGDVVPAMQKAAEASKELQSANADLISGAQEVLATNNEYAKSQAETSAQIADLTAQKKQLISDGWWAESEAVKDVQSKIDELTVKYSEDADAHAEASKRKLLDMSLEAIAMQDGIAGFSEAEAARAQALLEASDAGAAAAFKEQQAFVTASQAIADGTIKAKDLDTTLKMMAKGYTIQAVLSILSSSNIPTMQGHEQGQGGMGGFAAGGISSGPASGHMELLHGTEAVIPLQNGSIPVRIGTAAGTGGDNSGAINVTAILEEMRASRLDENRLARAIVSAMKREV